MIGITTLRARLTLGVVLIVLVAAVAVATLALRIAETRMQMTIGDQQEALLASAAAQLDNDIDSKNALLQMLAEGLEPASSPKRFQEFLENRGATLRDEFDNIVIVDKTGMLVADLSDRRNINHMRLEERPYFRETLESREGVVSPPFRSKLSGKSIVVLTQPVISEDGTIEYVLMGTIDLERPTFFGQISQLAPGRTGYLFALTRDGLMLHHPDTWRLLHNVSEGPGQPVPATLAAMHGWEGWTLTNNRRGVYALISFRRMRTTDWVIGSVYPAGEAFSSIHDAQLSALLWATVIALVAGVAGWFTARTLLTPLSALRRQVRAVEQGDGSIDAFDTSRKDEVGALAAAFYSLSLQRANAEARLETQAVTDPLTGLGNRRKFNQDVVMSLQRINRTGQAFAVAFLDLDRFKQINDEHGHDAGDAVLVEFSRRLVDTVRATDHVYRLAGDEFVIILEHVDGDDSVDVIAQKVVQTAAVPFPVPDGQVTVTTSAGFCRCADGSASVDELLKKADVGLYEAKAMGRNRYVLSSTDPSS